MKRKKQTKRAKYIHSQSGSTIRASISVAAFAAASALPMTSAVAQTAPRIPRTALPANMAVVAGNFGANIQSGTALRPVLSISQQSNSGILTWGSFDIGADATVNIDQPSSTATLLNKVLGGAYLGRTTIEGMLNAKGQVYIYNPNGIIFGKSAQVNLGSLVATTLKIDDNRFLSGLTAANTAPIFTADTSLGFTPGAILVEGENVNGILEQAGISAAKGGRILLVAPQISNSGKLLAPDGQVMLVGANNGVYLDNPSDTSMRGLRTEVSDTEAGASVTNTALGHIDVGRGNATLASMAVNQNGVIKATTSVNLNGSIYLKAQGGASKSGASSAVQASVGGTLTLGAGSESRVDPDLSDKATAPDDPAFKQSQVFLAGTSITLEESAKVIAKAGDVRLAAGANPSQVEGGSGSGSITLQSGALIDVSGTTETELAMESNVIEVELRSQLADNILLRNSSLRGSKVKIDVRKGTSIANLSDNLDAVERTIGERSAGGGTVTMQAGSAISVADGSIIDISGGKVTYKDGYIATSKLTYRGSLVDIGSASASIAYDGVLEQTNGLRNFEDGYEQGYDAGTFAVSAKSILLGGEIKGSVITGARQRDAAKTSAASGFVQGYEVDSSGNRLRYAGDRLRPLGGRLDIGNLTTALTDGKPDFTKEFGYEGNVVLGADPAASSAGQLNLDMVGLTADGVTRIRALTKGSVTIAENVAFGTGGELLLGAQNQIDINADIASAGGKVTAMASGTLSVADSVSIDLAGRWTNDLGVTAPQRDTAGNPTTPVVVKGGTLALSGNRLEIGDDVSMDVSGGAWLDGSKKLSKGSGGSIALEAFTKNGTGSDAALVWGSNITLAGYGFSSGGSLKLTGREVTIGGANQNPTGNADDLYLPTSFFTLGGFTKYNISALRNLTLTDGSLLSLRADSWSTRRSYDLIASGDMDTAAIVTRLDLSGPLAGRPATSLVLSAPISDVDGIGCVKLEADSLETASRIDADPGAKISVVAGRQVTVDGILNAPGGTITVGLTQAAPAGTDTNYRAERSVWFGEFAQLTAKGTADLLQVGSNGSISGELLGGGTIQVGQADKDGNFTSKSAVGYVVAETGALFDVSGTEVKDVSFSAGRAATTRQDAASDGGSIDIRAREGLLLDGAFKGKAGSESARNGSLSITLDRENSTGAIAFPQQDRKLIVTGSDSATIVPDGLEADQPISGVDGTGWIRASQLDGSQFDRLALKSQNLIAFEQGDTGLSVNATTSLTLDSPALQTADQGTVSLNSAYVRIGNSDARYQAAVPVASAGNAKLNIVARSADDTLGTVDLIGNSTVQGFQSVDITAIADVRLVGLPSLTSIRAPGSFVAAGDISIVTGQTYVSTLSDFHLAAQGSVLSFTSNGRSAPSPLSAGGILTATASKIQQDGVVRAPFGSITLDAETLLSYGKDSLTSVAGGASSIPFGYVQNGNDWLYDYGNGHIVRFTSTPKSGSDLTEAALPEKVIVSRAPKISQADGAILDLAGGGDLYAYQFTPGPGGSKDVLAKSSSTTSANQTFAVLPGFRGSLAPVDPQYGQDGGLQAGDSVYLSGIPGLPAGIYTLLPAHYALMEGGFAITAVAGTRDMSSASNTVLTDGSRLVAGYTLNSGSGKGDTRWSGFNLQSSAQVRNRSEYSDFLASTFFPAQATASNAATPRLPQDGGRVAFDAGNSLTLAGLIRLNAASGGRRGDADISADEINLVGSAGEGTGTGLTILASDLANIGAESLLLGGLRERGDDGVVKVSVGAERVTVGKDAAHPVTLAGKDIILVANDTLTVKEGATITGSGDPATPPTELTILGTGAGASGALLRVTGKGNAGVIRDNPDTTKGTLNIEAGSAISASGAVILDATKDTLFAGAFDLKKGAALTLGARRISLGSSIPAATEGLLFDTTGLLALNGLTSLSLTSYSTLDFYGSVVLGNGDMDLTLGGQGIQGYGTRQATIIAKSVQFNGASGFTLQNEAPVSAAGVMDLDATDIRFGGGAFQVKGFSSVSLEATREARGAGGSFSSDAPLTLTAGRITAASGSETTISSSDALTLAQSNTPTAYIGSSPLGGKLHFSGNSISSSAQIEAHAGSVELAASNGVEISGGTVDVSGVSSAFGSSMAYAPGGSVSIDGGSGNVTLGDNATINVSAVGASAGGLTVKASSGQMLATGQILASSSPGKDNKSQAQGSFSLDVGSFPLDTNGTDSFGALNAMLDTSGFAESRNFRLRNGSISLGATETITAHEVRIAVDNGDLGIDGTINANGTKGGTIELFASQTNATGIKGKVSIGGNARLSAAATESAVTSAGSTGDGGLIVIGSGVTGTAAANYADATQPANNNGGSSISLATGAVLDVSGKGAGRGGSVRVRAPRTSDNNDVSVSTLAATVVGASEAVVEGYKVYSSTTSVSIGTAADADNNTSLQAANSAGAAAGKMYSESNDFLSVANKSAMQTRLGTSFALQAGVEVRAANNITVSVNELAANPQDRGWNMNTWRFGGEPGQLVLRATENLTIIGSINDGFVKPAFSTSAANKVSMPGWNIALNQSSWSYGLAAGADLASANYLAVTPSSSVGDFNLAFARTSTSGTDQAVALIRTGTGRIDIAAGRDVKLAILSPGSDNTGTLQSALGATIYTAGTGQALADGFTALTGDTRFAAWGTGSKTVTAAFADDGGAISIAAARDVIGASTPQLVNQWLYRQGKVDAEAGSAFLFDDLTSTRYNTAWWARFDYFNENIATFGGGDVLVSAGRDITDFSASVATNAYVPGISPSGASLVEQGGGDLVIRSGADIKGGMFYVQKGSGTIDAGGSITYSLRARGTGVPDPYLTGHPEDLTPNVAETALKIRPVLALGDGSFSVTGREDVEIQSVINPTMVRQSTDNASKYSSISSAPKSLSMFTTYSENSAVDILSIAGNVRLVNDFEEMTAGAGKRIWDAARGAVETGYRSLWLMYPGTVNLAALNGDIQIQRGFTLAPSAVGNLSLLADESVVFSSLFKATVPAIYMLDVDPATVANVFAPRSTMSDTELGYFKSSISGITAHTQAGLHREDPISATIYARNGNIISNVADSIGGRTLIVPKRLDVYAAGDIENFGFAAQHFATTDVTTITAGGSIVDATNPVKAAATQHTVSGPGRVEFVAGQDIDLGNGGGIVTRGNLDNPYLDATGASVVLSAGTLSADYPKFMRSVFGMTGSDAELSTYAETNKTEVLDLFFAKLAEVTGATGKQALDLNTFDTIIASLFPTNKFQTGDINVFGSQVKTEQGGSIDLFAPGGSIYAGLASVPKYIADKPSSKLGIFTIKGGEIRSLVKQDFQVNQGRVFTLGGGDVTLVSQYGNIDAGRGSKTAAATPPPILVADENGNAVLDISGSISGSGIATLRAYDNTQEANVYPIAPRGIFDAGDAGLRSTGTVNIVAQTILNAANITANSGVTGLNQSGGPVAPPPAPVNTSAAAGAQELAKSIQQKDTSAASLLTVELISIGGADGQQNVTQGSQNGIDADPDDQHKKKKPL